MAASKANSRSSRSGASRARGKRPKVAKAPKRKVAKTKRSRAKAKPAARAQKSASELAKGQRDISVSEFFAKNRHLLGFDNPRKALLTAIKEAVDNSLDACEEAGILPEIWRQKRYRADSMYR